MRYYTGAVDNISLRFTAVSFVAGNNIVLGHYNREKSGILFWIGLKQWWFLPLLAHYSHHVLTWSCNDWLLLDCCHIFRVLLVSAEKNMLSDVAASVKPLASCWADMITIFSNLFKRLSQYNLRVCYSNCAYEHTLLVCVKACIKYMYMHGNSELWP